MKDVVFDTSLAVKWFFPESGRDKALGLKNQHLKGKIQLCTCDLFLYEITSCLRHYTPIRIEEKDFVLVAKSIQSLGLKIYPLEYDELEELFTLSRRLDISVYDYSYLLLAQKLKSPFYTADKRLHLKIKDIVRSSLV